MARRKRTTNKPATKTVEDPAPDNPGLVRYRVRRPVEHDGHRYVAADTVELTPLQAAPLIATGALEAPSAT